MELSVLALLGCTDNSIYIDMPHAAIITGNTYKALFTDKYSINKLSVIGPGSQILMNASGSLQTSNKILTYSGDQWKTENGLIWSETAERTMITAIFPAYSDCSYTEEELYQNHSLEDILYIKDVFPTGNPIKFQFKHLFSLLTFHLDEKLQSNLQRIEISCPIIVSQVIPESADIVFDTNKSHITSIIQSSPSGEYSFIIPPAENMAVTVTIYTSDKKYTKQLQSRSFAGNQQYQYNLKTSEKTPGIVTAEDWIAFSKLINNDRLSEYKGKKLKDFGETIDGVTTYYLLNDIDFEGINCKELEQIGCLSSLIFKDVFDGQNHTISNLVPKSSDGTTGVFGIISENSTIKNLHLNSCNATIGVNTGSKSGAGLLVGVSYGKLLNCSVKEGSINSELITLTGGLAGESRGAIINCSVQNTNLSSKGSTGGLAGSSRGVILNCFSANNTVKNTDSAYSGGISGNSGASSSTTIINCYVHSPILSTKNRGIFLGSANKSTIEHSFYSTSSLKPIGDGSGNQSKDVISYNPDFPYEVTGTAIYSLLNQWITDTAPTLYPNISFTRWTNKDETLPAIFIEE